MHKIEYHPPRVLVFLRLVSRIVHDEFTGYRANPLRFFCNTVLALSNRALRGKREGRVTSKTVELTALSPQFAC